MPLTLYIDGHGVCIFSEYYGYGRGGMLGRGRGGRMMVRVNYILEYLQFML